MPVHSKKKVKKTTPIINATKKMVRKDAVALGRVVGKNPLSDKVIARENKKKKKNIERFLLRLRVKVSNYNCFLRDSGL